MVGDGSKGNRRLAAAAPTTRLTRGVVRFRDGRMVVSDVLRTERIHLRRAGFCPHELTLMRNDGTRLQSELWMQDEPSLVDYLNAAHLLFDDEPGSLEWDVEQSGAGPRSAG